jgi:two-component system copper resistance phosphate regulon response regulator CusR
MRVLIVEDDPRTAAFVRKGLLESGFAVDATADGHEGLHLARTTPYDVVVLDVMLPGLDGFSILRELRAAGRQTPVIVLSARGEVEDRVRGLRTGADDYLVKPFAFSELLARINAILRRGAEGGQAGTYRAADLVLEVSPRRVSRGGKRLDLTPKEFALLELFLRHRGEVLTRTFIAERVWDMNFDSDTNVVDVHIRRLRAKIDDPFEQKLVRTVRGVGYVLDESQGGVSS